MNMLVKKLYDTGRMETTTGNYIFYLEDLDGYTPQEAAKILASSEYGKYILDMEYTDETLDIIYALDVCPYFEDEYY